MTRECGRVAKPNATDVYIGDFLAQRFTEWFTFRRVYCSRTCRDFRAHALGVLASAALKHGVLLEYEVGDFLACTERLMGLDAVQVAREGWATDPLAVVHVFQAVASHRMGLPNNKAWVYDV